MRKTLVELRGLETRVKGSNKTNGAGTGAGNKKKRKSVDVAQDVKRVKKQFIEWNTAWITGTNGGVGGVRTLYI